MLAEDVWKGLTEVYVPRIARIAKTAKRLKIENRQGWCLLQSVFEEQLPGGSATQIVNLWQFWHSWQLHAVTAILLGVVR